MGHVDLNDGLLALVALVSWMAVGLAIGAYAHVAPWSVWKICEFTFSFLRP